jgi:hypothetical protein
MAKTCTTSINDINILRKYKIYLYQIIKKIKTNDNYLINDNLINQCNELIQTILGFKIFSLKKPVIFSQYDYDFIESLEIMYKDMREDNIYDETMIKKSSLKFLELIKKKEEKYKLIYGL